MNIAVNFVNTYNNDPAISVFTCEYWQEMAQLKPDQHFIFLADSKTPLPPIVKNVDVRVVKQTGARWLDQWRLSKMLKHFKIDRLVEILPTGFRINYLPYNKRQGAPNGNRQLVLYEPNGTEYAQKQRPLPDVALVKPAWGKVVKETSWTAAESTKTTFTGGRAFFLFAGNIALQHQLIALLKAFSIFKKWQQSNMQLVIAGYNTAWTGTFVDMLEQYKFRADVVLITNPSADVMERLIAASYVMVMPMTTNTFCPFFPLGLQSGKAIVISDLPVNRAIAGTAEWVDKNDTAEGFARAMILLYKNEKHLQWLIQESKQAAAQFNRAQMLASVWNTVDR